ncbi:MAG: serine/threonine protein kinase [Actinomycetota bacterium]|nr:serine/threonine protein kinase [Actinomycetota bacterium]
MKRLGGRFVLEREIGAGGMSVVFLGRDEVLDRLVAVKILRGGFENSETGARFQREGRTAARLAHPNIVPVYDAGEDEFEGREVSYIVMEYVPGGDLKRMMNEKGPLAEKELSRIGADVASGLAHAHEKGIIHRDIKPQNILIDAYGGPKLTDFGIARALDDTHATRTGSYLGTASYSSPEQLRGEVVTPKSDVYSLGCTLYEAAVGEPPFSGGLIEVASQQLNKPPDPPRMRGAVLSETFEALVLACMAKDSADRPSSTDVQERLLKVSALASGAAPASPGNTVRNLAGTAREAGASGGAGMASAVDAARAAGAKGFETVIKGLRDRVGPPGAPEPTPGMPPQVSHQAFPARWNWQAMLAAGAAALLLLALVAVGAYALLGTDSGEEAGQVPEEAQYAAQTPTAEETAASSEPPPPATEAQQAVYNMYVQGSYGNVDASREYLSQRMQESEEGSQERWEERFVGDTIWRMWFSRPPVAQVSGETAEVQFQLNEIHDVERRIITGTATCVVEDGTWKVDSLEEETRSLR